MKEGFDGNIYMKFFYPIPIKAPQEELPLHLQEWVRDALFERYYSIIIVSEQLRFSSSSIHN